MFDNNLERAVNYLLSEQKDSSSSSSELPFGARSSGGGSGKERKGEGDPAPFVPRPQSEGGRVFCFYLFPFCLDNGERKCRKSRVCLFHVRGLI